MGGGKFTLSLHGEIRSNDTLVVVGEDVALVSKLSSQLTRAQYTKDLWC